MIGNANYQVAPPLANPSNDARSVSRLLDKAGFEVTAATDLTRSDMTRAVEDSCPGFQSRTNADAMIYMPGTAYSSRAKLPAADRRQDFRAAGPESNSVRLVDLMGTLQTITSRVRIVVLDACRNNPFPDVDDSGRGLAVVDAPGGSIVGYSTAPGMVAHDGEAITAPIRRHS